MEQGERSETCGGHYGGSERRSIINEKPEGERLWLIEIDEQTRQET